MGVHAMTMPYSERRVYLPPTAGSPPLAVASDRDDLQFTPNPALEAFSKPIMGGGPDGKRQLSLADTQRFIPIVERRLELSRNLIVEYEEKLAAKQREIDADEAKIARAYEPVKQAVMADDARLPPPSGAIVTHAVACGPDVWLASRNKYMRDTPEWENWEYVKMVGEADAERHLRERAEFDKNLNEERIDNGRYESRLYDLREHLDRLRSKRQRLGLEALA